MFSGFKNYLHQQTFSSCLKSHSPWHLRPRAPSCSVSATAVFFPGQRKEGGPKMRSWGDSKRGWRETGQSAGWGCLDRGSSEAGEGGRGPSRRSQVDRLGVGEESRVCVWCGSVGTFLSAESASSCSPRPHALSLPCVLWIPGRLGKRRTTFGRAL